MAALQQMPPLQARNPSEQHPTPAVHRSSGQHWPAQAMFSPPQQSPDVVHWPSGQQVRELPQQLEPASQQALSPVPHTVCPAVQQVSVSVLHCSIAQQPEVPQQVSTTVAQHPSGSEGQTSKSAELTHSPSQQTSPSVQLTLMHWFCEHSQPHAPSSVGPQSLTSQQPPFERSAQEFSLVPPPQQVVLFVQQRSGLVSPPGQRFSAGQQKSSSKFPPQQTVLQQPSTLQQKSGAKQHSFVSPQYSARGGN
jgi:hypothetical protein